MNLLRLLIVLWCLWIMPACLSVKLGPTVEKSSGVEYSNPGSAFQVAKLPPADRAWKSEKTGNIISYFSECSDNQISLERMREDVLLSLPQGTVKSSESVQFDDREALSSQIEGRIEGIPVLISLLVYQKNGCRFSLSFSGRADQIDKETSEFERFKKGFRAP